MAPGDVTDSAASDGLLTMTASAGACATPTASAAACAHDCAAADRSVDAAALESPAPAATAI